ncbi:stage V sporulation T C-terminal domain-containing protein, partial [Fusobacterium mortiferum]|uniref:stage V sporulation T C-terminal domain-containing protein n=1 Tax=Fusobacterium mortiferum TaxID=850 RepID=UPI001E126D5B|nr:AAA family ATPase [Fusobacterium mortiferum]
MSFLKKIQNYVKDYAEIISDILQCDVEIVDEDMVRIAGTGLYSENINELCKGTVYKHISDSKKSRILINPKEDELCKECTHKNDCTETLEMAAPIFYKDKVIGVIGLICFTEEDKKRLLKNMETHLKFTEKIADFISGKVFEVEEEIEKKEIMGIMKQIINNYDKCVLVIDNEGKILDGNEQALKELKIESGLSLAYQKINIIPKNEVLFGKDIFSAEINKEKYNLIGTLIPITGFSKSEYKIFLFEN